MAWETYSRVDLFFCDKRCPSKDLLHGDTWEKSEVQPRRNWQRILWRATAAHTIHSLFFFRESEEKARMVGKGEKLVGSVIRGARQWAFCFQLFASNPRFFESASFPAQKGAWTRFLLDQDDCWGGGERKCISEKKFKEEISDKYYTLLYNIHY